MNSYPFDSILLNGRDVRIQSILSAEAIPRSDFEATTFSFISNWFSRVEYFVQHTSGSTGTPKTIAITRAQMIASAKMTEGALDLKEGYHALLCLNPAYIAGKMMLVRSFVTGMKIIAVTPSANPLMDVPTGQTIDFAALVPYQIHEIVRSVKAEYLHMIKTIIIGGAMLDVATQEKLQEFKCKFYATYGMTETISHVAFRPLNGKGASEYYTTLPGIEIQLDNRDCLVIRWNHLPDKIITNDLVEIKGTNTFKWLGRWDNVINTGGFKVIPEKIEIEVKKIFKKLAINQNFFVSSLPNQKLGNKVVLILEGSISLETLKKLKATMDQTFSGHEVPREVFSGIPFIFTENGKINRKATLNLTRRTIDSSS